MGLIRCPAGWLRNDPRRGVASTYVRSWRRWAAAVRVAR